jgi:hypothetical protein
MRWRADRYRPATTSSTRARRAVSTSCTPGSQECGRAGSSGSAKWTLRWLRSAGDHAERITMARPTMSTPRHPQPARSAWRRREHSRWEERGRRRLRGKSAPVLACTCAASSVFRNCLLEKGHPHFHTAVRSTWFYHMLKAMPTRWAGGPPARDNSRHKCACCIGEMPQCHSVHPGTHSAQGTSRIHYRHSTSSCSPSLDLELPGASHNLRARRPPEGVNEVWMAREAAEARDTAVVEVACRR